MILSKFMMIVSKNIFEFFQKLDESKFDMLKIRPQSNYFQMTSDYLEKNSPRLSLEDQRSPFQLSKAFVLISTYNGTNSLECLKSGRPTIFFWDKRYASYAQEAQPYLDELARTGVLQYESSGAAELLNQDSTHILRWWHSAEVQKAVSAYLAKFGDTSGGAKKWASTVSELYHLEIEKY
jgi:putative transferase (TIGR04331 family)